MSRKKLTGQELTLLIVTELIRWATIIAVIYLSVWQYGSVHGYTVFIPDVDVLTQFWLIVTAIIVGLSLVVYLPWRVLSLTLRQKFNIVKDERWRPAIVVYIVICATPCFTLVLIAYKLEPSYTHIPPAGITVLQLVVIGLVITEWMVKIQQETFSFQLVTAMSLDFFFAFDVIAFVMMCTSPTDSPIYLSGWVYACVVFAVISMFKYVPTQPLNFSERGSSIGHLVCIVTSMFCNDIPFFVIRLSTMIIFGFLASDMIFALKNAFTIAFHCVQIGAIVHGLRRPADDEVERGRSSTAAATVPDGPAIDGAEAMGVLRDMVSRYSGQPRSTWLVMDRREFRCGSGDVWCALRQAAISSNRVSVETQRSPETRRADQQPTDAKAEVNCGCNDNTGTLGIDNENHRQHED